MAMSLRRQVTLSLCQNELADHNNVLVFRPEHIHCHWLEMKILNESVYVKSTPIGNMNAIHQPFLLFEHEEIKAMHSLPWLRVGWIVFYETRETDRNLNMSVSSSILHDSFPNPFVTTSFPGSFPCQGKDPGNEVAPL